MYHKPYTIAHEHCSEVAPVAMGEVSNKKHYIPVWQPSSWHEVLHRPGRGICDKNVRAFTEQNQEAHEI